jgi:hypothetical protein
MVITTVGDMDPVTREWIKELYKYSNATEFALFLESARITKKTRHYLQPLRLLSPCR